MMKLFLALALAACAVLASASAQTVYKCTQHGTLSYSDRPCSSGIVTELAPAPPPDRETAARLARQNALAKQLTRRDALRAQQEERAMASARRLAAVQRVKCERLRLRQHWAQEDLRSAGARQADAARVRARRQAEAIALECPG